MYCRKCGEDNPDNAVFCRNCGERLVEEVKKAEVITDTGANHQETRSTTTTSSSNSNNDLMSCCICVVVIFIVFGILGAIFHL